MSEHIDMNNEALRARDAALRQTGETWVKTEEFQGSRWDTEVNLPPGDNLFIPRELAVRLLTEAGYLPKEPNDA